MPDMTPFADGSTERLRAGDTVYHVLAQEEWVVLADTGRMVAWAGWPAGIARRADLVPRSKCSDAIHRITLDDIRAGNHPLREIILHENGGHDA